ncbi:hypothetical protein [Rhizobium etli]|uniref:Uncharacterized protein n=1 Tax=Rhizobium etli TaxID=29449 RepID=A0A7W7ECP3_RHIET|nr:hypothetical protein [Rhizobium etli]MBB4478305.1 hypothetical protein [Rhizobium etli]MBB4534137.1 hypothetical protein [Rhizobium etli]
MARKNQWIRVSPREKAAAADDLEKQAIIMACGAFIDGILKPRFLPEIRQTEWNCVVDIKGSWAGNRYRFEVEIERRNASGYDKATSLLVDLKTIADEDGDTADFTRRLHSILENHARKERLIARLNVSFAALMPS